MFEVEDREGESRDLSSGQKMALEADSASERDSIDELFDRAIEEADHQDEHLQVFVDSLQTQLKVLHEELAVTQQRNTVLQQQLIEGGGGARKQKHRRIRSSGDAQDVIATLEIRATHSSILRGLEESFEKPMRSGSGGAATALSSSFLSCGRSSHPLQQWQQQPTRPADNPEAATATKNARPDLRLDFDRLYGAYKAEME